MRILVIGSGGREHAIVRALSAEDGGLHAAPGNPGMAAIAETHPGTAPVPDQIVSLARKLSPDLVVIGPEAPLVAGAADALRQAGINCFGPDAAAARIEGSKSFAKQVMAEAGIPTAASFTCRTGAEADRALAAMPGLPGAACRLSASRLSARTRACSRPPDPMTRMRTQ